MTGPDLDVLREPAELRETREHLLRAGDLGVEDTRGLLEEVGPPDIAHEDEVAGEDHHGLGPRREVVEHERDVLGRVARGV